MVEYLETKIVERYETETPTYGMTAQGYTKRGGAPTRWMIRLDGETRFRRLMIWQFSNAGTCFVKVNGRSLVVREYDIPEPSDPPMKFRDLRIGDRFDFIGPERLYNSFFAACTKTGKREYSWDYVDGKTLSTRVRTVNVRVYHVERACVLTMVDYT